MSIHYAGRLGNGFVFFGARYAGQCFYFLEPGSRPAIAPEWITDPVACCELSRCPVPSQVGVRKPLGSPFGSAPRQRKRNNMARVLRPIGR